MKSRFNRVWMLASITVCLLVPLLSHAQDMSIDIVNGSKSQIPITVVPFATDSAATDSEGDVASVIGFDLARSGRFRSLPENNLVAKPHRGDDIRFAAWKLLKQDYITVGQVSHESGDTYKVSYELWDVNQQEQLLSKNYTGSGKQMRRMAHRIADDIFEEITGIPGAFDTRIAYVTAKGVDPNISYAIVVADSDGYHPQTVVRSHAALLSPTWSPDGNQLAYVSFESGDSAIYIQDLKSGSRHTVTSHKGINSSPAWSPDGSKMAVSLSHTGNPEIYVINLASKQETRLTNNYAIDTEPEWSPDGRSILFTSDRSGGPQIYEMPANGGKATRLTFNGRYNSNVSVGYKGEKLAMVRGKGNVYRINILDRKLDNQEYFVSPGNYDEDPSFAPNGSMLLYAATQGQRGVLYAVSEDGSVRQRLVLSDGNVRSPAWGPFRSANKDR